MRSADSDDVAAVVMTVVSTIVLAVVEVFVKNDDRVPLRWRRFVQIQSVPRSLNIIDAEHQFCVTGPL
jgi:hypothetical protein